jgi:outer membrane receptor protein involved in Fe transport
MINRKLAFALLASTGVGALCAPAHAQTGAAAATAQVDEVVVTGSRIARSTFQTPTPVTAVSQAQLEAKAASTVTDLLRDVPALRPNRSTGSSTDVGGSTFNMRSLGSTRTLVLVDGQRVMNSSPTGSFDLNLLPAALINRMEIVTAGASSVYGSDAVTGVVNVFLDNALNGGRAELQGNVSQHGDAKNFTASLAYGGRLMDDRLRYVVAGSYFDRPDVLYQNRRSWGRTGVTLIPNSSYTATNGQYRQLIVPGVTLSQMTFGGVITTAGPLRNIQFGQGGAQSPFVLGSNFSTIWMQGGGGLMLQPDLGVLQAASRRKNFYTGLTYEFTPTLIGKVNLLAAQSKQTQTNSYGYSNAEIVIRRDNVFLPANIQAGMVANNLQSITIGRLNPELGISRNTTTNTYVRGSASLAGELSSDWSWDVGGYYTYALYDNTARNNRNNINWNLGLDAVAGPNGQATCRSTLTSPGNGCVPINIFGLNTISPAGVAYAGGTSWINAFSRNEGLTFNVKGKLGRTWAGDISVALGAETRRETVNFKSDPVSQVGGWRQASSASYRGEVKVKEGYAEALIPLAKDMPLAQDIELDLAGRYVDYSTSGVAKVWKAGLNWTVNDIVRLRGTVSRDFRAPNINELFSAATLRGGTNVIDRTNNSAVVTSTISGGNRGLGPETAHTKTAGIVLRPIQNLQLSVDGFDIKLKGAISTVGAQDVVDRCFQGSAQFCGGITRNAAGVITVVSTTTFNAQQLSTRGIDFEASYRLPLDTFSSNWNGNLTIASVATYVDKLLTNSNGVLTDTAGQLTGNLASPKWRSATTFTYDNGPATVRMLVNYIGKGRYDNTYGPLDLNDNNYPGFLYYDLSAQYNVTEHLQVYGKIENLFDKDPPLLAEGTIIRAGAANASSLYDTIGRMFGIGARYKW